MSEREYRYQCVVKELVKRYIIRQQQRDHSAGVTEDDLNEIKQDISSLRFELLDIFKNNGYKFETSSRNNGGNNFLLNNEIIILSISFY